MSQTETSSGSQTVERVIAARVEPFSTSVFTEMTRLAIEHEAINLSQGFPDFDGPGFVKDAAAEAIAAGRNQYARPFGEAELVRAIADWYGPGLGYDPMSEITVTSGCTEAMMSVALGLIGPGDEVVAFEPFYDSYPAVCSVAGAKLVGVALRPPEGLDGAFVFDEAELRAAVGPRTRVILLNTPHNPTGKVFSRGELEQIARIAIEHDLIVVADEVYEKLVYGGREHVSIASLDGMRGRTVTCSSLGKTFSLTGWKLGWAAAPAALQAGIRAAHQYTVFASPTPLQHAAAVALREGGAYISELARSYEAKRDLLVDGLRAIGFRAYRPEASYFVLADHTGFGLGDDVELCRYLIAELGVAAIPPSAFYEHKELGRGLVRLAFCKRDETLTAALERLGPLRDRAGGGV